MLQKQTTQKPKLSLPEFAAMMAYMISLAALSIDAMLPVIDVIGRDLGVIDPNKPQLIIGAVFLGLAIGQLAYGPISDAVGRKPAIYAGLVLFTIGCLLAMFAKDFDTMLLGRFLQGIGVAGPRIVSIAVVRDIYSGREMAKVSSFIMSFFIIVPALAPLLGQFIADIWNWQAIYFVLLAMAVFVGLWYGLRQSETLHPEFRRKLSLRRVISGFREALSFRVTSGYALAAGIVFGSFVAYLMTSPQLFADIFGIKKNFPYYFGALAICIGMAAFVNARLVMKLGMRKLCKWALFAKAVWSGGFFVAAVASGGVLPLEAFMIWAGFSFFLLGILFGNVNAVAMEPVGHIAGFGSSVVGFVSGAISLSIGMLIGQMYTGTVLPLIGGFALLAPISILVMKWADKEVASVTDPV
ncbi:MAG: multidrug effflux MFS transporter [Robiginitomaculum sp.]|nr:multidrug effflux MFS transporter [Robiginitomaculum sp.]